MTSIAFERHLPRLFLAQIERHPEAEPFTVRLPAAVMMTDISGFSALAVALTRDGEQGVEALQALLDTYFGALGAVVARFGGDICTFAGDAVIAAWPEGDDPLAAASAAVQCALAIQREAPGWSRRDALGLTQRIAVARGELLMCKLGGAGGKWLNVFAGPAVVDSGRACDVTTPGRVLVTPGVAALLQPVLQGDPGPRDCTLVTALAQPPQPMPPPAAPAPAAPAPPPPPAARLAHYVPEVLVRRARAGQDEWLAEFRRATVMFVKLGGTGLEPAQLQALAHAVQAAVQRYGGALPYLQMDDKGLNFIIAYGIPTAAYEDDAARALMTGLEVRPALRALGLRPSIGVATGVLFCGECGAADRRQYSMIGPAINLAARLTGTAVDDLLADEATCKAAGDRLSFTIAHNVQAKGSEGGVLAFRPEWRQSPAGGGRVATMVGREAELAGLLAALQATAGGGPAARLLVSGEPGIGKSRLLLELRQALQQQGFAVVAAEAQALEHATPYFAWRELLRGLLARLAQPGEDGRTTLARQLHGDAQLVGWAPLLDDIVPLGEAATDLTREMRGTARAQAIHDLVLRLVERACAARPLVLVVDDLHWVDAASAGLLSMLAERAPAVAIVAGTRPLDDADDTPALGFGRLASLRRIELGALGEAQVGELVARMLDVDAVPGELTRLIHGRCDGNPFYAQQLTLALREGGHIDIGGGRCRPHQDIAERIAQSMPATLRGVIVSRVDRLGDEQQLLLKVASVFGRVFSAAGLAATLPEPQPPGRIGRLLAALVGSRLVVPEAGASTDGFAFSHALVQEAIYNLLPMAQRRRQHRRIADWLEAQPVQLLAGQFGLLAGHCMQAEEFPRAVEHLEGGARTAMRHAAYREAIRHLETAQRVAAERQVRADALRRATWHSLLGDSRHELSELKPARAEYLRTLDLLGRRHARGAAARAGAILADLGRLALAGWREARASTPGSDPVGPAVGLAVGLAPDEAQACQLASHAFAQLSEIAYYENDPVAVLHLTLRSAHEAQRGGSVRELSAAHGALAIAFGQMGLPGVARRHVQRSIALARSQPAETNGIAYAHLLAMVFASSQCDWALLDDSAPVTEGLYAELGERFRIAAVHGMRATSALQRGRLAEADAVLQAAAAATSSDTPARVQGWRLSPVLQLAMLRGRVDVADIHAAERALAGADMPIDRLMSLGSIGAAWLRVGEPARALAAAREGLDLLLGRTPVAGAGFVYGPLGVVEVLLAAWDQVPAGEAAAHAARTERACAVLRTYTRQVPSTRPRGLYLLGCHAERLGAHRRALALWRRAAQAAAAAGMPIDEAEALLALGRRQPDRPDAQRETDRARSVFASLQVPVPDLFTPGPR